MNKFEYLSLEHTAKFSQWLSEHILDDTFHHSWTNRRTGELKEFFCLFDAFEKYEWKFKELNKIKINEGKTFTENEAALNKIQFLLKESIKNKNQDMTYDICCDIMHWGGVQYGNVKWLTINKKNLIDILKNTSIAFMQDNLLEENINSKQLRFNAGMTKIYSLLVPNFIIYDSRVAASLAWAARNYSASSQLKEIPDELKFPVTNPKESTTTKYKKIRNPSEHPYHFPALRPGSFHAKWNMKTNWILEKTIHFLDMKIFKAKKIRNPMRALESALFMLGYDLSNNNQFKR